MELHTPCRVYGPVEHSLLYTYVNTHVLASSSTAVTTTSVLLMSYEILNTIPLVNIIPLVINVSLPVALLVNFVGV